MGELSKRSTVYFEPDIHKALRIKAATSDQSISEIVNEIIRDVLRDDHEDLRAIADRVSEPTMTYSELLDDLKSHGKI